MKMPRSLLHGYDKYTERIVARVLHIPMHEKKHHKAKMRHIKRRTHN